MRLTLLLVCAVLLLAADPAAAHHVMGGRMPATLGQGLLSGLGHPVIGLDHFAAVIAIGCLAAAQARGVPLVVGYVLAMIAGAALHVGQATLPASEILVALSVIVLGLLTIRRQALHAMTALALFALAGFFHGYALGESIAGAEPTPLYGYFAGLAVIQSAVALGAMRLARRLGAGVAAASPVRLIGAGIAGIGLAVLVQQIVPGV